MTQNVVWSVGLLKRAEFRVKQYYFRHIIDCQITETNLQLYQTETNHRVWCYRAGILHQSYKNLSLYSYNVNGNYKGNTIIFVLASNSLELQSENSKIRDFPRIPRKQRSQLSHFTLPFVESINFEYF